MERNTAIITINLFKKEYTHDLEVPLDISVNELCSVMNGRNLKICFLFSCLENNGDFMASEMTKITRELGGYILCEDIGNIKLFGSGRFTPAELRQFKKSLIPGDAYEYNPRDGIRRIKLVDTDEG